MIHFKVNAQLIGFLCYANLICQAQVDFSGCDSDDMIQPGFVYQIKSPNYSNKYPGGTLCRYKIRTMIGYQITLTCSQLEMTYYENCSGDRLQVSRSGNENVDGGDRYCTGPFKTTSYSNQLVFALLSPPGSPGGLYFCEVYASQGCDCGRKKQTRIVGGTETAINEYPGMAALISKANREVLCGATIIDANYALTAAHCVNIPNRYADDMYLLVGEHDYTTISETPFTAVYELKFIRSHENYDADHDLNDIAIIGIKLPLSFNTAVGPVCLPFKYQYVNFTNRKVDALGWGLTSFTGTRSTKLMKVSLDVISNSQCEVAYSNTITTSHLCTFTPDKDFCAYDSGGPLLFQEPTGNQYLYQLGISSFGTACATNKPGVSTRISSHLQWITRNTPDARFCYQ